MKKTLKLVIILIVMLLINARSIIAVNDKEISNDEKEMLNVLIQSFEEDGITKTNLSEAIEQYKGLSKEKSNEEIAQMLEESKSKLNDYDTEDTIDKIIKILRNSDEQQLNYILEQLNVDETINELESGATIMELIEKATANMTTVDKANFVFTILKSTKIIYNVFIVVIVLTIYKLFVRCVIYKKAKKKAWAVLIPIYKDVTMLKICGMSPWWLLLILIPIIGWSILWIVKVASKFMLAESFNKSQVFGLGLWLLWPIFEGILAFSKKSKYIGIE